MARKFRLIRRAAACVSVFGCALVSGVAGAQLPAAPAPATEAAPASAAAETAEVPVESGAPVVQPLASTNTAGYSLERCIALTLKNYPKLHEARARLSHRRAQQVQSWTQPYSEFNVTGGLALVPEVHGTALYSPDSDLKYSNSLSGLDRKSTRLNSSHLVI